MVDEREFLKQYSYKATSNLVLQQDRGRRRDRNVGSGEVEALRADELQGRMGDKAQRRDGKPPELLARQSARRGAASSRKGTESVDIGPDLSKGRAENRTGLPALTGLQDGANVVDVANDLELDSGRVAYVPTTDVSQKAFETLLSFVASKLGDQPRDLLRNAADEALATLKDQQLNEAERKKTIEKMWFVKMSADEFARLSLLGRQIKDFGEDEPDVGNMPGKKQGPDTLSDPEAVAVVFDNEEEDVQDGDEDGEDIYAERIDYGDEVADNDGQTFLQDFPIIGQLREDPGDSPTEDAPITITSARGGTQKDSQREKIIGLHEVDGFWLQRQLGKYYDDAHQCQKVAEDVLNILSRNDDDGMCENRLVLLLDREKFDFISMIVENREAIVFGTRLARAQGPDERRAIEADIKTSEKGSRLLRALKPEDTGLGQSSHDKGAAVVIDGAEEDGPVDSTRNSRERARPPKGSKSGSGQGKRRRIPLRNLDLDSLSFHRGGHTMSVRDCKLPTGSEHVQGKDFEEWHIPAIQSSRVASDQSLVPISSLPRWSQAAFQGTNHLNRMQSTVFSFAFGSDENMLLCAPTGAGKTNVAVLTILRAIKNSALPGLDLSSVANADLTSFKIVYVAPMKALVAEVVQNLGKRLADLGLEVRELTGDVNLSRREIENTHVIVTTPEKWDIITRKSNGRSFTKLVRLLIVDEIHLLHDERGPVLESIIARTSRSANAFASSVRVVGLSATLPNYRDVAAFLRVDPNHGLFHFDATHRPCPLQQCYVGITTKKALKRYQIMNELTYQKVKQQLMSSNQVIVFVHSRKETVSTCQHLISTAIDDEAVDLFLKPGGASSELIESELPRVNGKELGNALRYGLATHHAGMTRADRSLVESLFEDGHVKVLISTATLAWGVNLPAHAVIIKGTQVYSPEHGRWIELSSMDVMQMMGRAGRPQFDKYGEGIIITSKADVLYYLSLLNQQLPIESQLISRIVDMLNAEIAMGAVSSVEDGSAWLSCTYLYVRMLKAPVTYGISVDEHQTDPTLERRRAELVHTAGSFLHQSGLVKYDKATGSMTGTDLGRIAADYYVSHQTLCAYVEQMKPTVTDVDLLRIFSLSGEFRHMKVREEEKLELFRLAERVPIPIKESLSEPTAKVNVLLQAYISRLALDGLALRADMVYITQSAARLSRALLQIAVQMKCAPLVEKCLRLCKIISARQWASQSPLRQFGKTLGPDIVRKMERKDVGFERYYDLTVAELGELLRDARVGRTVHRLVHSLPRIELGANVRPLSRSTVEVELQLSPDFRFDTKFHGSGEMFWVLVEDADSEVLLHSELFFLRRSLASDTHFLSFLIPLTIPQPPHYFVKCVSDTWIVPETVIPISFRGLLLPEKGASYSKLLDVRPLSVRDAFSSNEESDEENEVFDPLAKREARLAILEYFVQQSRHFTPLETQLFHCMFRANVNAILATVPNAERFRCAELCVARLFSRTPTATAVWVVTKGEVAVERVRKLLTEGIGKYLNLSVGKLLSSRTADLNMLRTSGSLVVTTSERWDMFTRRWKMKREKKILEKIGLVIVDGIHALGNSHGAGATTEVMCSRMRYMAADAAESGKQSFRIVALSDPVANAREIGQWLGVPPTAVFSFHPREVDVRLRVHITTPSHALGTHGLDPSEVKRHVQSAMRRYFGANTEQALVFVANRRVARYAALELANGLTSEELHLRGHQEFSSRIEEITIDTLRDCVTAGVAYVYQGMPEKDRILVDELFRSRVLSTLVATAGYCWEYDVPPAQVVFVMGTSMEQGGGFAVRRAEYPQTDLFRMMFGHADSSSLAHRHVVLVTEAPLQDHYRLRIEDPLPAESQLPYSLSDHMNAEIVAGVIETKQDAVDYLTWTFFYRRLPSNPNYYGMKSLSQTDVSKHLSEVVDNALSELEASKCVATEGDDDVALGALNLGIIASHYYVRHATVELFASSITQKTRVRGLLDILSLASEFGDIPVRIRDEEAMSHLSSVMPVSLEKGGNLMFSSPHVKTHLLLQAHLSRHKLNTQLQQDLAVVLPIATRLLRAMVDIISSAGWLKPALAAVDLSQMIIQGMWDLNLPLLQLPHVDMDLISTLRDQHDVSDIFEFLDMDPKQRTAVLQGMSNQQVLEIASACEQFPDLHKIEVLSIEHASDEEDGQSTMKVAVQLQRQEEDTSNAVDGATDETAIGSRSSSVPLVVAPRYPDAREEGWWIIIGDKKTNSLLTLKHVALKQKAIVKLEFLTPAEKGKHELELYLRSDSYVDCDQDDTFEITVKGESNEG